jgi:hypothetical protein
LLLAGGGVVAVAVLGLGALLVAQHRGGDSVGSQPTPVVEPRVSATAAPAGLDAALLTADDLGAATVTGIPSQLKIAEITCGVTPAGEVDERRVAFQGSADRTGRGYYDGVALFATSDAAGAYMRGVLDAARACPQRITPVPPAPHLGDQSVRVLFPSVAHDFVFDATYVRRGRVVCVVMVSASGTAAPPPADAVAVVTLAVQRLAAVGT